MPEQNPNVVLVPTIAPGIADTTVNPNAHVVMVPTSPEITNDNVVLIPAPEIADTTVNTNANVNTNAHTHSVSPHVHWPPITGLGGFPAGLPGFTPVLPGLNTGFPRCQIR